MPPAMSPMHLTDSHMHSEQSPATALTVESVQVGKATPTPASSVGVTGIDKRSVEVAHVETAGLVGDSISDTEHHGGPDQAVYVYTRDDYDYWEGVLARSLPGGAFGENITLAGLSSSDVQVGDRLVIGDVVLEATSARIPCGTFQHHMGEDGWVARFRDARRPGVYCRVLAGGDVSPGASVDHQRADTTISILETQDLYYTPSADPERIEIALKSPLAARTRALLERRLNKA